MTITDITYGIPAEVWPRDYSDLEQSFMFFRAHKYPVKIRLENGQEFIMFIFGLLTARNKVDITPIHGDNTNRVRLPIERIATIEPAKNSQVQHDFTGRLTINADEYLYPPSKRDFFKICRNAYQNEKAIRIYMADGQEIEGVSQGVNAFNVQITSPDGRKMIVMFDWVERIVPF